MHGSIPASRLRLASVLRTAKPVVSVGKTAQTLGIQKTSAAQMLARWCNQGWLRRVGPGLYVPAPLDLVSSEQVITDPWVLVPALFGRCYIGGWTAAHHWDLTEQLFSETLVFTTRRIASTRLTAQGAPFILQKIRPVRFFGLVTLWRESTKVSVSDPARTLVDMLAAPEIGGGIDHVADCLKSYFDSKSPDADLLIRYAQDFRNGAVFKRLGFLADVWLHNATLAAACQKRLTQGNTRLDPNSDSPRLITRWRLWIPERWGKRPA